MLRYSAVLFSLALLPVAYNQLFTFKDGKIGVNFFGFNAEAGLGGLLTGNAAHGGLSASAGTPFGQRAAAGLGGTIDENGRPMGGGFAAANAGAGLGASAALGGRFDEQGGQGGLGSEAHGAGYSVKKVEVSQFPQQLTIPQNVKAVEFGPLTPRTTSEQDAAVAQNERQRIKTKYAQQQNDNKVKTITKEIIRHDTGSQDENSEDRISTRRRHHATNSGATATTRVNFQQNPNFFNDIFNIPISALNAVNQFLNNGLAGVSVSKTKTVDYERH